MKKKDKIWMFVMIFLLILDIVMHFASFGGVTAFASHLNYIASVLMSFTVGLWVAETPRFKDK